MHRIEGFAIPHGESYTICRELQYNDYRPSVYYVYCCSPPAIESIHRLKEDRDYKPFTKSLVLQLPDLLVGKRQYYDSVGALLYFNGKGTIPKVAHWYGSSMCVNDAMSLGFTVGSPTTIQVAISILNAMRYIYKSQSDGFITPEDLNYKYMLDHSKKYLGKLISKTIRRKITT